MSGGTATHLVGDVFDRMAGLDSGSVDLVMTSPPFLALRSYLPDDHPDKAKEIGTEATPAEFLDTLLALTAEWERLLAPHGTIAVELGDTYSGSGGAGGDYGPEGLRDGQEKFTGSAARRDGDAWPLDKSLTGIPTLYAWSLAYGRNLLTGEPSPAGQWRIRNLLTWCRPNPPVGALGDKFRPGTSFVTVATKASDRWFDLTAVRSEPTATSDGAPPLDWLDEREIEWQPLMNLSAQPYPGSHYATFPSRLPKLLIEAMCPRDVCRQCGEPRRRIVESERHQPEGSQPSMVARQQGDLHGTTPLSAFPGNGSTTYTTTGWTDCGHDDFRPGLVLDPFGGSGTTGVAATGLSRDCVLIDLDERNADLARERIGMFLTVEEVA